MYVRTSFDSHGVTKTITINRCLTGVSFGHCHKLTTLLILVTGVAVSVGCGVVCDILYRPLIRRSALDLAFAADIPKTCFAIPAHSCLLRPGPRHIRCSSSTSTHGTVSSTPAANCFSVPGFAVAESPNEVGVQSCHGRTGDGVQDICSPGAWRSCMMRQRGLERARSTGKTQTPHLDDPRHTRSRSRPATFNKTRGIHHGVLATITRPRSQPYFVYSPFADSVSAVSLQARSLTAHPNIFLCFLLVDSCARQWECVAIGQFDIWGS